MSFVSLFSKPQTSDNQHNATLPVADKTAQIFFKAVIQSSFYMTPGLTDEIAQLFPMDKVVSCDVTKGEFTVTFTKEAVAKIDGTAAKGTVFENAKIRIPKIVKGRFEGDGKLSFPSTDNALKIEKPICGISAYTTLSGVEYRLDTDDFVLTGLLSVTVPRAYFQKIISGYKFA